MPRRLRAIARSDMRHIDRSSPVHRRDMSGAVMARHERTAVACRRDRNLGVAEVLFRDASDEEGQARLPQGIAAKHPKTRQGSPKSRWRRGCSRGNRPATAQIPHIGAEIATPLTREFIGRHSANSSGEELHGKAGVRVPGVGNRGVAVAEGAAVLPQTHTSAASSPRSGRQGRHLAIEGEMQSLRGVRDGQHLTHAASPC